jgi:hypothetical protein
MISTMPTRRSSALERTLVGSSSRRRRRPRPAIAIRHNCVSQHCLPTPAREEGFASLLLDEQFDELECELLTLLKVANQL